MGMLKFEVPNAVSLDDAKKRVEALLAYWKRKYNVNSTWDGLSATMQGKAVGVSIDGALTVLADKISGEAKDPGMLLRGQAQKYLTRKFAEYLNPDKTLEQILSGEE
jgi:Putative polyhydroxyalkanoic acid system protein (PHA_gran_rgn)